MTTATEEIVVSVTPRNRANFRRLKTNSIQSYKRWEKENELLYAMMEDESEWLAKLFPDVEITPDFYFYALEDGSLLCRLANYIQEKAELYSKRHHIPVPGKKFRYHTMGKCSKEIKLFKSRENVQQFLTWCRSHGIPEAILFESNDVVQVDDYREGCRGIIICLMEIVRRTAKFELDELPKLIQMEKEIEEDEAQSHTDISNGQGQVLDVVEINNHEVQGTDPPEIQSPSSMDSDSGVDSVFDLEEGDNAASRLKEFWHEEREIIEKTEITTTTVTRKQNLFKPKDQKSSPKKTSKELPSLLESTGPKSELDKQVCKIAQDYNIKIVHRLKEGKYIILGRIMFVRMLNDHMLVRIGGGWDTLEHYLMTHAPSKEALETPSTPSSQAFTSSRNSISANSGVRTSLIEKYKKKEQVAVVNRDSPVYSSQGSLHQQLGNQTSPKIKDRGKRSSLTGKDEKDITEAIRKISSSVSQTLADRPASFTSRTFNILKSRFDKGIFGASRRTSSPDISVKGSKIRRRLSDTTAMADLATTLAFDGEQVPVVNNNVSEEKQPDSESTEEIGVGKIVVPNAIASGEEPQDNTAPDQIDGTVPAEESLSSEQSRLEDLLGSQANGNDNMPDVSSFDPLAAAAEQDRPVLTDTTSSEKPEEQPSNSELIGNGELPHDEQPSEPETTVEPSPPQDLDNLLEIADTKPVLDNTPEASPRLIDIGDLLQDSQVSAAVEGTVESSPLISVEETAAPKESAPETEGADAEPVNSDNPVVNEDTTPSVEDVPPSEVDPSPEAESQPPEVTPVKIEEPSTGEETVGISESLEPSKLEEEPAKPDEAVPIEETAAGEPEPPKPEEGTVTIDEPVSLVADVKSEGESTEVAPTVEETSTQEESQAQEATVVEVAESALVIAAEVKEEQKPVEDQPLKAEKPKEKTTKAKPAAAGTKEKSASKPSSAAKKPTGAARPTSPTKVATSAAAKKDVKPPTKKVPPSKPASANAFAVKATVTKVPTTKTPATKTPTSAAAGVKKLAAKSNETKADEAKKPQRPKSAISARPSTQPAGRATSQAPDKKVPASATKTPATKPPGQDVKDGGPPKSAPKTTTARPSSAKPTPKTTTTGKKPLSAKPTPTPSTKPVDSKDGTAPPKKPAARPTSAKPKPTTSSTTTTTTVKKTTTITTTVTKSGTAAPGKTPTTTTKTVTQAKTGQPKTTASTTTTTKTSAKAPTRPTSAAKKPADIKPASTGAKSKIGGKPSAGSIGGRPAPKSASKKKTEEPVKEKEIKQEDKQPISQPEPEAATEEKPTEEVETKTEDKPTETVETVSEERPVSEAISEEKSTEPTPDSSAAEQTPESIEVSSKEFVDQSNFVTHVITTETTTTVNEDGEEQTATTTEESVNEQTVEGS